MSTTTNEMMQAFQCMQQGKYAQAMAMFQRLLNEGNEAANYYLGRMYEKGWGVKSAPALAKQYYQTLCESDPSLGKISLAKLYVGQKNFQAAVELYVELADSGDISAAYWAYTLFNIELKSPANQIKADEYLQKAANLGHLFAMRDLYVRQHRQATNIFTRLRLKLKIFFLKPLCVWILFRNVDDPRAS